jgi:hypothetical protein
MALGLMILLPTLLAAQTADSSSLQTTQPKFWVESTTVDAGKVKAGEYAVATFIFHNDSDQPIKILKAKPS